jgi:hypothetical protein
MSAPTSSYATAGIALRVSGALKPHHHDKVETPSVGFFYCRIMKILSLYKEVERRSIFSLVSKLILLHIYEDFYY